MIARTIPALAGLLGLLGVGALGFAWLGVQLSGTRDRLAQASAETDEQRNVAVAAEAKGRFEAQAALDAERVARARDAGLHHHSVRSSELCWLELRFQRWAHRQPWMSAMGVDGIVRLPGRDLDEGA